jgi:hypothetical protein
MSEHMSLKSVLSSFLLLVLNISFQKNMNDKTKVYTTMNTPIELYCENTHDIYEIMKRFRLVSDYEKENITRYDGIKETYVMEINDRTSIQYDEEIPESLTKMQKELR